MALRFRAELSEHPWRNVSNALVYHEARNPPSPFPVGGLKHEVTAMVPRRRQTFRYNVCSNLVMIFLAIHLYTANSTLFNYIYVNTY